MKINLYQNCTMIWVKKNNDQHFRFPREYNSFGVAIKR